MATFAYSGRTRGGETVAGERMGDSMEAVAAALRREQIQVTRITPVAAARAAGAEGAGQERPGQEPGRLHAAVLGDDRRRPAARAVPRHPRATRRSTSTSSRSSSRRAPTSRAAQALADAMKRHPKVFDALYTNMIAAGEAGGILDTILKRLAVYIEKAVKLKSQVQSAMIYPIAVIVIAAVVVGVILWKVIPTFASLFAGLGRRTAPAHAHRHLAQQQPRPVHAVHHRRARRGRATR